MRPADFMRRYHPEPCCYALSTMQPIKGKERQHGKQDQGEAGAQATRGRAFEELDSQVAKDGEGERDPRPAGRLSGLTTGDRPPIGFRITQNKKRPRWERGRLGWVIALSKAEFAPYQQYARCGHEHQAS